MTLRISSSGDTIPHRTFQFSGGEVQVRIDPLPNGVGEILIEAAVTDPASAMELLLATDALRRLTGEYAPIHLRIPYLPYARQDRVCAPGEALALKVFCGLINAQGYASVEVWDAHSDVALALLDRASNVHQSRFVQTIALAPGTYLVAPDAGATKKIVAVASVTGLPIIQAGKVRDTNTGAITGTRVFSEHLTDRDVLIVDDICDGGRTFLALAAELRKITDGRVLLYVTHGIFSQGLGVFEGVIDHVYCPNIFPSVEPHPLLTRIAT